MSKESSPMLDMAITYLLGLTPERRLEMVNAVCDTLGVRPEFWRSPAKEAPPVHVPCIVRIPSTTPDKGPFIWTVGVQWDGSRWMFGDHEVEGVRDYALIPD